LEFRVLGSLEVLVDGKPVPLGGPKQRAVLAMLLTHPNEVVSRGLLVDALWGERAPPAAQRSLDSYVSRLRAVLGADRILRRAPGYLIDVTTDELDVAEFERLAKRALDRRAEDPRAAVSDLEAALGLWRGPALADLGDEPAVMVEAARLEERRLRAEEALADIRLAIGEGPAIVATLERLVAQEPLQERPRGQLMLALYQSGRAPEALDTFQSYRRLLADELGLEPGPTLRELERRILQHDPALTPTLPSRAVVLHRHPHRRAAVATMLVVAAGVGAGLVLLLRTSAPSSGVASQPSVVELRSGSTGGAIRLRAAPGGSASGAGSLWVTEPDAAEIVRIDPATGSIDDRIPIVGTPGPIAFAGGAVWVTDVFGARVLRIDPATDRVVQSVDLGSRRADAIAGWGDRLWVADVTENALVELDAASGAKLRTILLAHRPSALLADGRTIWVASYDAGVVDAVDRRSGGTVASLRVGNGPVALAAANGAIWVANSLDSTVSRIDPASGLVAPVLPVGSSPSSLAVARGSLWVGNEYGASVTRIDPTRATVAGTSAVGGAAVSLAATGNRLWVGIRPLEQHRGGTLVLVHQRPVTIDPAFQQDLTPPQSDGLTRDSLVTYDHAGAPAGLGLVPDLAVSLPTPTDDGRTYTFRMRPGLRYSDGRPVRTADFRRALERLFFLGSPARDPFGVIEGAAGCVAGERCDLALGVATDEQSRTVTYRLVRRDPGFLVDLTSPAAAPVPRGTRFAGGDFTQRPIPGTGPYRVISASSREIRYVRNPFFHEWSHAAQPDGNPDVIVMRFGLTPTQETHAVENGTADWSADQIPAALLPEIIRRYGDRLHSFSITETDYYRFNIRKPPFSDLRVRQAVNLALNRTDVARTYGGRIVATPTCQILPPGVAGYRRYCPYTRHPGHGGWTGPDVARARALVARSGTHGASVSLWGWTDDPTIRPSAVAVVARTLRVLGYRVHVDLVPHVYFDSGAGESMLGKIDMLPGGWLDTAPANFFGPLISCGGSLNRFFCSKAVDALIVKARNLEESSPRAASAAWARTDRAAVDRAAWLSLVNPRQLDFVSARVGNFQHHPYWDILADQLWVK
jgi:DNA-binding SARP family transcriptional activator/ABC-type transport system substrate-binding protein